MYTSIGMNWLKIIGINHEKYEYFNGDYIIDSASKNMMFTKKLMDVDVSEDMNSLEKVFLDSGIPQLSDRQILESLYYGFHLRIS